MKLTEDRFDDDHTSGEKILCCSKDEMKQILENQEKADRYDSIIKYVSSTKGLFSNNVLEWVYKTNENQRLRELVEEIIEDDKNSTNVEDYKFAFHLRGLYNSSLLDKAKGDKE